MHFKIIDWGNSHTKDNDGINMYNIQLFGRTANNNSIFVNVTEYKPNFLVKIPVGLELNWSISDTLYIKGLIYKQCGYLKEDFIDCILDKHHTFVGFDNKKQHLFLKLIFNSYFCYRKIAKMFENSIIYKNTSYKFELYGQNLDPMLKFMHVRDIDSCGIVEIKKYNEYNKSNTPSICDINIECSWENVHKSTNIECNPKFIMGAYDIECISSGDHFQTHP